ncbi:hypothetical protein BE11_41260 [Sorangium cellulosum]|nr:hypothetical protein BE11_41260 [Sorangium cellulosum]
MTDVEVIMPEFSLSGNYRVQSRREAEPSKLMGDWFSAAEGLLDAAIVNHALQEHPLWSRSTSVELRPALVTERSGKFANEPDILYKRNFFLPDPGTMSMPVDIVDVRKSRANWTARAACTRSLLADGTYERLTERLDDLDVVIANEYYLHEAGHFLGYDVLTKYQDGYFAPGGKTAWPLVYLEELRADLQAFGFGARLLPAAQAARILLYNVALRFGVHREGLATRGVAPYGLVPFLLFCILRELGFVSVAPRRDRWVVRLASLDELEIVHVMRACAEHAESELTIPELATTDMIERALSAAKYVRRRLADTDAINDYARVMESPSTSEFMDHEQS